MIEKVISGGQSGADLAGLRAAKAAGIPTGGWAPKGWLVEHGTAPYLGTEYGLVECPEPAGDRPDGFNNVPRWEGFCYRARTRRNVLDADATLLFGDPNTTGSRATIAEARAAGKPLLTVGPGLRPSQVLEWFAELARHDVVVRVVNIAGNRASKDRGIGERVERFLAEVFRRAPGDGD